MPHCYCLDIPIEDPQHSYYPNCILCLAYIYIYIYICLYNAGKNKKLYLNFQNLNFYSTNLSSHKFYHIAIVQIPPLKTHNIPTIQIAFCALLIYIYIDVYIYVCIYNAVKNKKIIFKIPEFTIQVKEVKFA